MTNHFYEARPWREDPPDQHYPRCRIEPQQLACPPPPRWRDLFRARFLESSKHCDDPDRVARDMRE